jgi:oxygen-dependent protoporphyrinogen oxidase
MAGTDLDPLKLYDKCLAADCKLFCYCKLLQRHADAATGDAPRSSSMRIAVVGGGITGLAAAFHIGEVAPSASVRLFEASGRLGGVLRTVREGELLIEQSADNFITNVPWGVDLCRRIGMEDDLLPTDDTHRQAFVVHRGKLVKVPQGFLLMAPSQLRPILTTPLLSPLGKLRLLVEWFIPRRRSTGDESLGSFVRRRFGREVFERLVQPLVGGIYTADPERLSLRATMPRFLEMERKFGSLIRATLKRGNRAVNPAETQASGARYGMFVAPREGMASIVERLAEKLPAETIQLGTVVDRLERTADGAWQVTVAKASRGEPMPPERLEFDAVIVAVPAFRAARLLEGFAPELARLLDQISYAGTSVVTLVYRRADVAHPLDGFGFVVPAIERRQILAASFASNKFPFRAPDDQVLIRVFLGGACQSEVADLADERLRAIAVTELAELLGICGEPLSVGVVRWPRSMPQYHVGHTELIERIESLTAKHPGLALAGNAYHGVGVPNCIHSGEQAAERIMAVGRISNPSG